MTEPRVDLLVLDVHGVVLNKPLRPFLRELAERTRRSPEAVLRTWDRELREPAWTGVIEDDELWERLAPSNGDRRSAAAWRARLESLYELGPAAPYLDRWRALVPIWLLSNHRTHWLLPRLARFGLTDKFERVLVSDALRAAKPSPQAFEPVLRSGVDPRRVLFLDDQEHNVASARRRGLRAELLAADPGSLLRIDRCISDRGETEEAVGLRRPPTTDVGAASS